MPDSDDAVRLINGLKSSVTIPGEWTDFYDKCGPVGTCWEDLRQYPRFHLRSPAAMSIQPTLPALSRSAEFVRVYIKDISRIAVALLHGEQLFPGEQLQLLMIDGIVRHATVGRCRRIHPACYEIAARFQNVDEAPDPM